MFEIFKRFFTKSNTLGSGSTVNLKDIFSEPLPKDSIFIMPDFIGKEEFEEHSLRYGSDMIYTKLCNLDLKKCTDAELLKEYLFFTRSYYKCITNERLLNILNSEIISRNIKILLLNGKGHHSFDIKLSKQYIEKYAIENNIDFELALDCFIIDVILDTKESNFSTLEKMAKENQLDSSKPNLFSILSPDERTMYARFKETNLME